MPEIKLNLKFSFDSFRPTRRRFGIFFIVLIIGVVAGYFAIQRIVDCAFAFGCDSFSIVSMLSFIIFWPIIAVRRLVGQLQIDLFIFLPYAWLVAAGIAQLLYFYVIACIYDGWRSSRTSKP